MWFVGSGVLSNGARARTVIATDGGGAPAARRREPRQCRPQPGRPRPRRPSRHRRAVAPRRRPLPSLRAVLAGKLDEVVTFFVRRSWWGGAITTASEFPRNTWRPARLNRYLRERVTPACGGAVLHVSPSCTATGPYLDPQAQLGRCPQTRPRCNLLI